MSSQTSEKQQMHAEPHPIQQGYPPPQQGYPPEGYMAQPQMMPIAGGSEQHPEPSPPQTIKHGQWQNGFCSCFDQCGLCCLGFWCPCILFGRTHARFQNPHLTREQLPYCSGFCCGYAAVAVICPGWQCLFGFMQRGDIRARYHIEGNGCMDCLAHFCCDCCALIQEEREVQIREDAMMQGMRGQNYY